MTSSTKIEGILACRLVKKLRDQPSTHAANWVVPERKERTNKTSTASQPLAKVGSRSFYNYQLCERVAAMYSAHARLNPSSMGHCDSTLHARSLSIAA